MLNFRSVIYTLLCLLLCSSDMMVWAQDQPSLKELESRVQNSRGLARGLALNELGTYYLDSSAGKALAYGEQSLNLLEDLIDDAESDGLPLSSLRPIVVSYVDAHLLTARSYLGLGNDKKATRHFRQARKRAILFEYEEGENQANQGLSALGKGQGGGVAKAIKNTLDALEDVVEKGKSDDGFRIQTERAVTKTLETMARQAEKNGRYPKAIGYYKEAIPYYQALNDSLALRETYAKLGSLYQALDSASLAEYYFDLSSPKKEIAAPPLASQRPAKSMEEVADDIRTIIEDTEEAVEPSQAETDTRKATEGYLAEARQAASQGDYKSSYESMREYLATREILDRLREERQRDSIENALLVAEQLTEIELLRRDQEIKEQEMRRNAQFRNSLILGMAMLLALAGLATYLFFVRRQAHRQTTQAYAKLESAHQQLKATQAQLVVSEKMASLGQLTAGIAHEINNPINFIAGNIHPLRDDIDDLIKILNAYEQASQGKDADFSAVEALKQELELDYIKGEIRELIEGIDEGALRTTEIVRGLRNFARLDESERKIFDPHAGLDSTLTLLRSSLTDIKVVRDYGEMSPLEGYPGKLNQVFMNLLTNAIQAMPEGGMLHLKTRSLEHDRVEITFRDTGKGIPKEAMAHIFEPFYTTKEIGEGTGLGLSISLGIIEQHQGTIQMESMVGQGTEVIIQLPLRLTAENNQ